MKDYFKLVAQSILAIFSKGKDWEREYNVLRMYYIDNKRSLEWSKATLDHFINKTEILIGSLAQERKKVKFLLKVLVTLIISLILISIRYI